MECDQCWSDPAWCSGLELAFACLTEELPTGFSVALLHLWFCWLGSVRNEILQSLNPKDRERESHPCVNLHREKLPQLQNNYVKLKSVSCTSNLLVRTGDFRKYIEFLLLLTSSLPGLLQNRSLETIVICIVVLCFPHNNVACVLLCDECMRSNVLIVCHILLSISVPHEQVCSQTKEYQASQYVPNIDTSEQFVSKPQIILQLIHFILLKVDDHPCIAVRLCIIA